MPSWNPGPREPQSPAPEPATYSAPPPPQPEMPSQAARAAYDEMVERAGRGASASDRQPQGFEPQDFGQPSFGQEPQAADLDSFAADELRRYLGTETNENDDEPFDAGPAFSQEQEERPDFTPRLFAGNDDDDGQNDYDAGFPSLDGEDDPTPAYGDAFGQSDAVFHAGDESGDDEYQPVFGDFTDDAYQAANLDEDFGADQQSSDDEGYDGSRGLQPFEARYDQQPPEVHLGGYSGQQDGNASFDEAFFAEGEGDAEFDAAAAKAKPKRRKTMMVAASLTGALALGGAVAFAYMGDGSNGIGSGEPPIIQADQRPIKTEPTDPGGKTFPHKNKLIYDRLQGEERAEQERVVPRQEDVAAVPDAPSSGAAGEQQVASASETATDADPSDSRRVRTFVVLPDGSVVKPEETSSQGETGSNSPAAAQEPASQPASIPGLSVVVPGGDQQQAAPAARPAAPAQQAQPAPQQEQKLASAQASEPAPPVRRPEPPQQAQQQQQPARQAAVQPAQPAPQAAPSSGGGAYVVQVAARKSQTDALAAFADLQQRYPQLLSNYRPIIERADLGNKGVWYRLRVGPMNTKTVAADLCNKLQAAGLRDCLVRTQ